MTRGRLLCLAGYVVSSFLAFPHPVGGHVIDLGFALAWVAPACLVAGLRGFSPASAERWGFLASLLAHAAIWRLCFILLSPGPKGRAEEEPGRPVAVEEVEVVEGPLGQAGRSFYREELLSVFRMLIF